MARRLLALLLTVSVISLLAGCGSNNGTGNGNESNPTANTVKLRPDRLPTLLEALVYEGWVVKLDQDSNWVDAKSLGKFFWDEFDYRFLSPSDASTQIDSVFKIDGNIYDYDVIAITLEPYPTDPDPAPSPTIIAESPIVPDVSTIMSFPAQFGTSTTGAFVIATFSDGKWSALGQDRSNERHGIWFLKLTTQSDGGEIYQQGVFLPTLPDTGYLYEGWVALSSGDTLSTGKFYFPDYQDYSDQYSELGGTPNFPGEDFLEDRPDRVPADRWPPDLMSGGQAFITVEPVPDNDLQRPSKFIVLRGNLPVRAADNSGDARKTTYPMGNEAALTFPRIEAVIYNQ